MTRRREICRALLIALFLLVQPGASVDSLAGNLSQPEGHPLYLTASWGGTESNYDSRDMEVIHSIIDNNGLSAPKGEPESWNFARWTTVGGTRRICELNLYEKGLTGKLDVSGLPYLQILRCNDNQLKGLDVSGTGLTFLNCSVNQIIEITGLSQLSGLQKLYCYMDQLQTLDLSGLTSLSVLYCSRNQLKTLDVSGLTALTEMTCTANQLERLDVSGLTELTFLDCSVNQLRELTGLTGLSALETLRCSKNQLEMLDLRGLTALEELNCCENQLREMTGLSDLSGLESLYCSQNQLKTLDLSGLTALTVLSCYHNQLESLDVSGLAKLATLEFTDNPYRSINTGQWQLTVNPGGGGTVILTAYYKEENMVELTAVPEEGYLFQSWAKLPEGAFNTPSTRFPITKAENVYAYFQAAQ